MRTVSAWTQRAGTAVLNFFFPRTCAVCGEDDPEVLCRACVAAFPQWNGLSCRVCGVPLPDGGARCGACRHRRRGFRFCRSAGIHDGSLRRALLVFKYGGREELDRPLGSFLAEAWESRPELRNVDGAVPVPLHFLKRRSRGFNQSERLARVLSRRLGLRLWDRALQRRRWTRAQAGLAREDRRANVEGAFVARQGPWVGRRVLLVDDVCTTGATLDACARALRDAGVARVNAITLARQIEFPLPSAV